VEVGHREIKSLADEASVGGAISYLPAILPRQNRPGSPAEVLPRRNPSWFQPRPPAGSSSGPWGSAAAEVRARRAAAAPGRRLEVFSHENTPPKGFGSEVFSHENTPLAGLGLACKALILLRQNRPVARRSSLCRGRIAPGRLQASRLPRTKSAADFRRPGSTRPLNRRTLRLPTTHCFGARPRPRAVQPPLARDRALVEQRDRDND